MGCYSRSSMGEARNVKNFGYRESRVSFPTTWHLEIARTGSGDIIAVEGIDISAGGIAIAVSDQATLNESIELAIRCGDAELARLPGRVSSQSADRLAVEFEFTCEELRSRVQELVAQLVNTV